MTFARLNLEQHAARMERTAEILKTIGHPVRLSVLECLKQKEPLSVQELMERTQTEQSLLSHHLSKMKDKGILSCTRNGKNILYNLADRNILNIFNCMDKCSFI